MHLFINLAFLIFCSFLFATSIIPAPNKRHVVKGITQQGLDWCNNLNCLYALPFQSSTAFGYAPPPRQGLTKARHQTAAELFQPGISKSRSLTIWLPLLAESMYIHGREDVRMDFTQTLASILVASQNRMCIPVSPVQCVLK